MATLVLHIIQQSSFSEVECLRDRKSGASKVTLVVDCLKNLIIIFFFQNLFGNMVNQSKTSIIFVRFKLQLFNMYETVAPRSSILFFQTWSYTGLGWGYNDGSNIYIEIYVVKSLIFFSTTPEKLKNVMTHLQVVFVK